MKKSVKFTLSFINNNLALKLEMFQFYEHINDQDGKLY